MTFTPEETDHPAEEYEECEVEIEDIGERNYVSLTAAQIVHEMEKKEGGTFVHLVISDLGEVLRAMAENEITRERRFDVYQCTIEKCECRGFTIQNSLSFEQTKFTEPAFFEECVFANEVRFSDCVFTSEVGFSGTIFEKETGFDSTHFHGTVDFIRDRFCESVTFDRAQFLNKLFFGGAVFKKNASFHAADFYNTIVFFELEVNKEIDLEAEFLAGSSLVLESITMGPHAFLRLRIRQLGKYHRYGLKPSPDYYDIYPLYVCLRRWYKFWLRMERRIRIYFPNTQLLLDERPEWFRTPEKAMKTYHLLYRNFRSQPGFQEEADRCYYKYRDLLRRSKEQGLLRRGYDWFIAKWCFGYGVYGKRILFFALMTVFLFGWLYYLGASHTTLHSHDKNTIEFARLSFWTFFKFSFQAFTMLEFTDFSPRSWFILTTGFERMFGVVLLVLYTFYLKNVFIKK